MLWSNSGLRLDSRGSSESNGRVHNDGEISLLEDIGRQIRRQHDNIRNSRWERCRDLSTHIE